MVQEDDFEFEHHSLLQNRANMQNNVLTKRKEQLKDWELSEVNKMTAARKPTHQAKVKFQDSDIFLSACVSGDEDEVEDLLDKGANINVSTIDGVTALHQAVIDDNLEMVRFLVEHNADIDAQDNEGWTPLHAAVCCGSLPIAKYLCEKGSDLTLTNSDKELAVDLAENDEIRLYLEEQVRLKKVDVEHCREREFNLMMKDCSEWIQNGRYLDRPHPRTGATALHVAASKGYNQLIGLLIRAGADVNVQDNEGWTPFHAAAHWSERDACRILMENGANVDAETFSGQNVLMVADKNIVDWLKELQESFRELRNGALQQQREEECSRESSLAKSSSSCSTSTSTSSSNGNGSGTTASFVVPSSHTNTPFVSSQTTGLPLISSPPTNFVSMTMTTKAVAAQSNTQDTKALSKTGSKAEEVEMDVEDEEFEEEEEGGEEMEEEEYEYEDEELSAETVGSSSKASTATSKTQPPSASAGATNTKKSTANENDRTKKDSQSGGYKTETNGAYVAHAGVATRKAKTNDRQSSVASTSSLSVDDVEEATTGSNISSIETTSRSVTPKECSSGLYSSDQDVDCVVPINTNNVSQRRHNLQKLPSSIDIHQNSAHQKRRANGTTVTTTRSFPWSVPSSVQQPSNQNTQLETANRAAKPQDNFSNGNSVIALSERLSLSSSSSLSLSETRPFSTTVLGNTSRTTTKKLPLSGEQQQTSSTPIVGLAPIARISSASSISESTTTSSTSSSAVMLRKNVTSEASFAVPLLPSRSGANAAPIPPWVSQIQNVRVRPQIFSSGDDNTPIVSNFSDGSSQATGFDSSSKLKTNVAPQNITNVSFEKRLLKPTIATSAKISTKLPASSSNNGLLQPHIPMTICPSIQQRQMVFLNGARGNGCAPFTAPVCSGSGSVSSHTPPTQPSSNRESESERKAKSRLQRHSRRSTQGVTLEHVGEAARQVSTSCSSAEDVERANNIYQCNQNHEESSGIGEQRGNVGEEKTIPSGRVPTLTSNSTSSALCSKYGVSRMDNNNGTHEPGSVSKWRSQMTTANVLTDGGSVESNKAFGVSTSLAKADLGTNTSPSTVKSNMYGSGGGGTNVSAYFKLPPHNFVSASSSSSSSAGAKNDGKSQNSNGSVLSATTAAASVAKLNRRSQVVRGNRRGTGPVDMEAISAASSARSSAERQISTEEPKHSGSEKSSKTYTSSLNKFKNNSTEVDTDDVDSSKNEISQSSSDNLMDVQAQGTYKLMYEKEQETTERLRKRVDELTRQLSKQVMIPNGIVSRSTGNIMMEDQERRSFERRIAALEYELEKSKQLQSDFEKLKDENMALIRVLKKLSK